jgi:uncharacterized membrane protein YGL010W
MATNKAELFAEYGSYHSDNRNRICHVIGIPMIVMSILGLTSLVHVGPVDLAIPLGIAVLAYYASFDVRGAILSLVIFALLYLLGRTFSWEVNVGAFVVGWIFQLVGHGYEGKKPKFLENLVYLLIGPLYVFEETAQALLHSTQS